MSEESKEQDLRDVLAEETSRGSRRKKVDREERRKQARLRMDIIQACKEKDEKRFRLVLIESGWNEDSPAFAEALRKFREAIRSRGSR
jgi:hypothetical protein